MGLETALGAVSMVAGLIGGNKQRKQAKKAQAQQQAQYNAQRVRATEAASRETIRSDTGATVRLGSKDRVKVSGSSAGSASGVRTGTVSNTVGGLSNTGSSRLNLL